MPKPRRRSPAEFVARRSSFVVPLAAVTLTFIIRLWFILEMRGSPFSTVSAQTIDAWYYHTWALDILHHGSLGSEVFFLRPLYPYLLAGVYALAGQSVLAVQLFQTFLAAASCFLLYDSTRRIFGRTAGLVAAFGFALTGVLVFYTGTLLYVEVTVFFSLLTLWLMLVAGTGVWRWVLAGVSFGLMVVCRPEMLVLLPGFLIVLWLRKPGPVSPGPGTKPAAVLPKKKTEKGMGSRTRVRNLGFMAGAALLVVAVVPIRNLLVARDFVPFTAHSGVNFYYGWNRYTDGTWQQTELERTTGFSHEQLKHVARVVDGREVSWSRASSHWTRKALEFVAQKPGRALWLLGRKFLLFWSDYEVPNNYYPETARPLSLALKFAFVGFGLIAALGLVGIVLALRRKGPRDQGVKGSSAGLSHSITSSLYPLLFIVAYLLSALVFYVLSRLRAPVIPFLLMFAGFGLVEIVRAGKDRCWLKFAVTALAAVVLYTCSHFMPVNRSQYSAQAWTQAGNIYMTMNSGRAFDAFHKALAAEPGNVVARYGLFTALAGMGNTKEAEVQYEQLMKVVGQDPRNRALAETAGGRLAIAHRDFPEAARHYQAAAMLDPLNVENYYLLGLVYISMDSLEQARTVLSRALELSPQHDAARSALDMVESHLAGKPASSSSGK